MDNGTSGVSGGCDWLVRVCKCWWLRVAGDCQTGSGPYESNQQQYGKDMEHQGDYQRTWWLVTRVQSVVHNAQCAKHHCVLHIAIIYHMIAININATMGSPLPELLPAHSVAMTLVRDYCNGFQFGPKNANEGATTLGVAHPCQTC